MSNLGNKLKTLRKENKFTASYICDKLKKKNMKYSTCSIYKWEEGKAEPNIYVLIELCKIFHTSISSILDTNDFEIHNLTKSEMNMLRRFRTDESFMKIAMLMLGFMSKNKM